MPCSVLVNNVYMSAFYGMPNDHLFPYMPATSQPILYFLPRDTSTAADTSTLPASLPCATLPLPSSVLLTVLYPYYFSLFPMPSHASSLLFII